MQAPVLEKAGEYLGTEHTYCETVKDKGMPIMYDDRGPVQPRQPVGLAPSTVWRWLSWLGGMPDTLRAGWELIRHKEPNATLHRQLWAIAPEKYRSGKRQETLIVAMQLLAVDRLCGRMFSKGIFPRYATSRAGP